MQFTIVTAITMPSGSNLVVHNVIIRGEGMALKRRDFFSAGTVALSAAAAGVPSYAATTAARKNKLLKIGILTCHPTHHHIPNIWGPLLNCAAFKDGTVPTRMTGMEMTHIWDKDPKRVETFCATFGAEPVSSYDGMIDKVDGIILSDVRNSDNFPELAEPYLKAGIPILFNRPFTSTLGRAKRIVAASKKYGTPFMTASSWEYCKEVYAMRRKIQEWGPQIYGVTAYNSAYEVTHDVHGVWIIAAMIGTGAESVSVMRKEPSIYEKGWDSWTIQYRGRDGGDPFFANLVNARDHDSNAWVKVILDKGTAEESLENLGDVEQGFQYYFLPPLLEFQRMIERGTMPQSHDHIIEKTAVFLAGFKSHLERKGAPVALSELEDDYRVPSDRESVSYPAGFFK